MKEFKIKKICCVGAGYVGGPTMAVIADNCPNIDVSVVDINKERIKLWNSNNLENLPVYEPGLSDVVKRVRNRNLFFSNEIENSIRDADMVFISVNTPIKSIGVGALQASDLKWVEACARQIGAIAEGHTIVVEKSTLPVRTAKIIKEILKAASRYSSVKEENKTFSVLSNPEFLAEGTAINDLLNPDRVLIGGEDNIAIESLKSIYAEWVPINKILCTSLWSSELSKLTANAFLAQRISSINSISAICEATGANVNEVSLAIGLDSRIGKSFLNAGPGFGGSCFKKDILNLVYLCKYFGLDEVADYWEQIVKINNWQQNRIYETIVDKLFRNLSGKKIAILGFAFKANTNDTRESPAIQIAYNLLEEGSILNIHDPKVTCLQVKNTLEDFNKSRKNDIKDLLDNWSFQENIEDSVKNCDAIVILTEWEIYKNIDWEKISKLMRPPAWVFDTRLVTDPNQVRNAGLNLWRIGESFNENENLFKPNDI